MYLVHEKYDFPASTSGPVIQFLVDDSDLSLIPAVMWLLCDSGKVLGYRRAGDMDNKGQKKLSPTLPYIDPVFRHVYSITKDKVKE